MMKRTFFSKRAKSGFTLIEVTMALAIMTVGAMGVMAMHKAAMHGTAVGRERATAAQRSRQWIERFRRDALQWTQGDPATLVATDYLSNLPAGGAGSSAWFAPVSGDDIDSYAATWNGDDTLDANQMRFCTFSRLTWLVPGEAARVDVRTWWLRSGLSGGDMRRFQACGLGEIAQIINDLDNNSSVVNEVSLSTVIRWTPGPR